MADFKIGDKILNRYEVKEIKEGGMGRGLFAIKTFKDEFLREEGAIKRFKRECRTWIALESHENIVLADFIREIKGKPYLFMEYVDGMDLSEWIKNKELDIPSTIDFAIQFCNGMIYANNKVHGIIHRDIKPSNIMISKNKVLKITDFGLVKSGLSSGSSSITSSKAVVGSFPYMSPEHFKGLKETKLESDIYSFGICLYEMLTKKLPCTADTFPEWMYKHLMEIPKNPREINPSVPKELNAIVMKCLQKNPNDRYRDFQDINRRRAFYQ